MFTLLHPTESYVSFTSINGTKHEVWPESSEQFYEGDLRPNGKFYFSLDLSPRVKKFMCIKMVKLLKREKYN